MTFPPAFDVDVPPRHIDMTSLRAHEPAHDMPASGSDHPIHRIEVAA